MKAKRGAAIGRVALALLFVAFAICCLQVLTYGFKQIYFEPTDDAIARAHAAIPASITWSAVLFGVGAAIAFVRSSPLLLINLIPGAAGLTLFLVTPTRSLAVFVVLVAFVLTVVADIPIIYSQSVRRRRNDIVRS